MALLDPGGVYGAAIKNGRQDKRGESPQRKPSKGPQDHQDQAPHCAGDHPLRPLPRPRARGNPDLAAWKEEFLDGLLEGLGPHTELAARLDPQPGYCCVRISAA